MSQSTNEVQTLKPASVGADEGVARWWFASLAVIKARAHCRDEIGLTPALS